MITKVNELINYMVTELAMPARKAFIKAVCKECDISEATFYRWREDHELISPANRRAIAELAGKSVEQLFG